MRKPLLSYENSTRCSKYELEMKQNPTYVQFMASMNQTSVKHEEKIITRMSKYR